MTPPLNPRMPAKILHLYVVGFRAWPDCACPGRGLAPVGHLDHLERLVALPHAVAEMEARVARITAGTASEAIWLLEHPPVYTAGRRAPPRLTDPEPL